MTYLQSLVPLARQAITQPREAATTLLSMGVPREALWPGFFLMVILSILLTSIGRGQDLEIVAGTPSPLIMALLTAVISVASVLAVWKVGQFLGGTGTFEEALLLTIFMQAILFVAQVIELLLAILVPPVGMVFSLVLIIMAVWINVNFIAALHGFSSLMKSLGVLLLASLGVAIVLVFLMSLAGMGVTNV